MIHQRVSLWLPLVFLLACSGEGGESAGLEDGAATPDEGPPLSDDIAIPPAVPDNGQPPPPPPSGVGAPISRGNNGGGGGGNGGGECATLCAQATNRGCTTPEAECVAGCNELTEVCGPEIRALVRCALRQFCPEDFSNSQNGTLILAACPNEANAVLACQDENPDDV